MNPLEGVRAVPESAAESLDGKSILPVQMPRKCLPRPAAGSSRNGPASSMEQQEIISYTNAGGRQFGAEARRRQYLSQKPLHFSDVLPGSTVALHCDPHSWPQLQGTERRSGLGACAVMRARAGYLMDMCI